MKNYKRIVLSAMAAAALVTAAAPAARAADFPREEIVTAAKIARRFINCPDWLRDLLCNWEKPEQNNPEPETPRPETPKPEKPEIETPKPEIEKPEQTPPSLPEENSSSVHAYEKAVAELVNRHRASYGLKPLTLSEDLCKKARIKSQDMADNRYFSHTSPTYGSPFDMMKHFGITYRAAGENIAMGQTSPEAVVTAWMNSQGHRENILSDKYTTLGVGYVADGNYWTQWFIG